MRLFLGASFTGYGFIFVLADEPMAAFETGCSGRTDFRQFMMTILAGLVEIFCRGLF